MASAKITKQAKDLRRGERIRFEGREELVSEVVPWDDSRFPDTASKVGLGLRKKGGEIERAVDANAEIEVIV